MVYLRACKRLGAEIMLRQASLFRINISFALLASDVTSQGSDDSAVRQKSIARNVGTSMSLYRNRPATGSYLLNILTSVNASSFVLLNVSRRAARINPFS
jgi:hypothetical protein